MGYYKNSRGIDCFQPDDTENTFYLDTQLFSHEITEIKELAKQKFPGYDGELKITAEYIHTRCLYYDLYDRGDYDIFLVISKVN